MQYRRAPIEIESPEQLGYRNLRCNLAESSVSDAKLGELGISLEGLVLAYGDHYGKPELRELLAAQHPGIRPADVLVTPGAAAALFMVHTALLGPQDQVVVQFPNYSTNLDTPAAIGCPVARLELTFENAFRFSVKDMEALLTPATRLVSITVPHNPTGTMISRRALEQLVELAERRGCYLLVDETYRDLSFGEKLPLAASLSDRVISVSSVSKAYGLPGIRIGWVITKNSALQELLLAAKEQIFICNSVVDEEIAFRFLSAPGERLKWMQGHVRANFRILESWMQEQSFLEWVPPGGGVVCFPRFRKEINIDTDAFYRKLNQEHGTYVGPGHWFGMDRRYFRIGFGWPGAEELKEGLTLINRTAQDLSDEYDSE